MLELETLVCHNIGRDVDEFKHHYAMKKKEIRVCKGIL